MEIYPKFAASPSQELTSLRLPDSENAYNTIRRSYTVPPSNTTWLARMFPTEFIANPFLEMATDVGIDAHEVAVKTNLATLVLNTSVNSTDTFFPELFYRHTATLTAVYCVAYMLVFAVGLIGNCFVIAVVFRTPRMRTVTNFFIVNLAVADILVIVFCLPATLTANIFVRK